LNRTASGLLLLGLVLSGNLVFASCATLSFWAPGDDGTNGRAHHYELRFSTYALNKWNWEGGELADNLPAPATAGVRQELIVANLEAQTVYYFALQAVDDAGNRSVVRFFGPILTPDDRCFGLTGNVDCSSDDRVGLSDVTRLIDYVYISRRPLCCPDKANTDGSPDGNINLADIARLIDYIYLTHRETAYCQ
jgi:hypothetical protein